MLRDHESIAKVRIFSTLLMASMLFCSAASASMWDSLNNALDLMHGHASSVCSNLLLGNRLRETEVQSAIRDGQAIHLKTIGHSSTALDDLILKSNLVDGVSEEYIRYLLQPGDALYAYDGRLIRFRRSDASIEFVPENLEDPFVFAEAINESQLQKVRLSWMQKNVFPKRADLIPSASFFQGRHSSWKQDGDDFIYETELKLYTSFFAVLKLRIVLTATETRFYLSSRGLSPRDDVSREDLQIYLQQVVELKKKEKFSYKEFPFAYLAEESLNNSALVIPREETESVLKNILQLGRRFDRLADQ